MNIKQIFLGSTNPIVSLRLCQILNDEKTVDLVLAYDLINFIPWYEYLARIDWVQNGEW